MSNVNDWPRPKHPWKDGQRPFGSYAKLASVKNYAVKLFPSAGGVYDYARLRSSLVAIVPQVHRHDGDDRKPQGHDSRRGRSPTPHKVHAVLDDGGGDETAEVGTNEPSSETQC